MKFIEGDRIAKLGKLRIGCMAIIFDETGKKVLLTRRTDNGRWCPPAGAMEPGESVMECCAREVLEETGLIVHVGRLIGIYSSPHRLLEYADGNRWHLVSLCFEAEVIGGELGLSDETTAFGYFSLEEIEQMDVSKQDRDRIVDAFAAQTMPFVK